MNATKAFPVLLVVVALAATVHTLGQRTADKPPGLADSQTAVPSGLALIPWTIANVPAARHTATPIAISGGYKLLLARPHWDDWSIWRIPDSWSTTHGGGEVDVHNYSADYEGDPPFQTITLKGGQLCDPRECNKDEFFPPGTITETIYVSGYPATLYRLPPTDWPVPTPEDATPEPSGVFYSSSYVAIGKQGNDDTCDVGPIHFDLYVSRATSLEENDELMSQLISIVQDVYLVPCYVDDLHWPQSVFLTPRIPGLDHYGIIHPPGATVTETERDITVQAEVPGVGPVSVIFEPNRALSEWEAARAIWGQDLLREIGTSVQGTIRTSQYIHYWDSGRHPFRVTTATPAYAFGTDEYWTAEQTVWAIMLRVSLTYFLPYP